MQNKVQLITYADRISGAGITQLNELLNNELKGLFSGVHILPFYYPIDGSDAGFDPIEHTKVDERIGTWEDVSKLGQDYEVMADLIVNHASADSRRFQDALENGKDSKYWEMFLRKESIFPNGASEEDIAKIYRPRPGSCFTAYDAKIDGKKKLVDFWTTFTSKQVDINVSSAEGNHHLDVILQIFAKNNVKIIRLDAAGYVIKKAGTSCFMIDETFDFIDKLSNRANDLGMETIAEIHSHHKTQIEVATKVNRVYDFALPPLILHALFNKDLAPLTTWLNMSPRNCLTVLDTHDGIGIVDVGSSDKKLGLLDYEQIDSLVERIHENSNNESKLATGATAKNIDIYQVNCSYYDALGKNDYNYLLARAIQFFAPGVPQVYYAGLLAMNNDLELLKETDVGRDINRPYLQEGDVAKLKDKPVVKGLFKLINLRNSLNAFNGEFTVQGHRTRLILSWENKDDFAELSIDLLKNKARITSTNNGEKLELDIKNLI